MYARKRLDIGWLDLAHGLVRTCVPPDRERALAAGCDGFLPKPYYPEQLRAVIDQYLPTHAKRTHKDR